MICALWTYAPQTLYPGKYNVSTLTKRPGNISAIAGRDDVIVDSTRVIFTIPMDTRVLSNMLYCVLIQLIPYYYRDIRQK